MLSFNCINIVSKFINRDNSTNCEIQEDAQVSDEKPYENLVKDFKLILQACDSSC